MINLVIVGAFFCYGVFTLQRRGFLFEKIPTFWRKFPQKLHEPLFACGVCVSSIWGIIFIGSQYLIHHFVAPQYIDVANIPFYIIAMCGICAVFDRAVKYFEYGYKYNNISPFSDYSYLNNYNFRDTLYECFLKDVVSSGINIVEIGGETNFLKYTADGKYFSINKQAGSELGVALPDNFFVLIKGIAYEGNFDSLLNVLSLSKGFIIEGSTGGESGKQLHWIMDKFNITIKLPYSISDNCDCRPEHCGNTNNRVVLIKPIK